MPKRILLTFLTFLFSVIIVSPYITTNVEAAHHTCGFTLRNSSGDQVSELVIGESFSVTVTVTDTTFRPGDYELQFDGGSDWGLFTKNITARTQTFSDNDILGQDFSALDPNDSQGLIGLNVKGPSPNQGTCIGGGSAIPLVDSPSAGQASLEVLSAGDRLRILATGFAPSTKKAKVKAYGINGSNETTIHDELIVNDNGWTIDWPDPGETFVAILEICDSNGSNCVEKDRETRSSTGLACPAFKAMNPAYILGTSESVQFQYTPISTRTASNYYIRLIEINSGGGRRLDQKHTLQDLSGSFGVWAVTIDPPGGKWESSYNAALYDQNDNSCGTAPSAIVAKRDKVFTSGADLTGALPENVRKVVGTLTSFGLGIAGGVAFLLLIYGSFRFVFSAGDPKAVAAGREIITAAVIGLIVIVFSVFLLRLIGLSILGLPI